MATSNQITLFTGENDMSDPLLRIHNHHAVSCGDPPMVRSDDPDVYIGYFENYYGEQWVFTYSRRAKQAVLRGGDIGWNTAFEVHDGTVPDRQRAAWNPRADTDRRHQLTAAPRSETPQND